MKHLTGTGLGVEGGTEGDLSRQEQLDRSEQLEGERAPVCGRPQHPSRGTHVSAECKSV